MRQRYLEQDRKINWMKALPLKEDEDAYLDEVNQLTEAFPRFCDFVPTEAVMRQLVLRAAQIQDPTAVLWQGFTEIVREDGSCSYKPDIRLQLLDEADSASPDAAPN
jgi:hypothetical protein